MRKLPVIERKMGSTLYIVSGECSDTAKENPVQMMRKILLNNERKSNQMSQNDGNQPDFMV